jgi:hypothetical protein
MSNRHMHIRNRSQLPSSDPNQPGLEDQVKLQNLKFNTR